MTQRWLYLVVVLSTLAMYTHEMRGAGTVVINEVMYHPSSEISDEEFIEIFNISSNTVALGGWQFTKGIRFTFPDITLASGDYLVISANTNAFQTKYPGASRVIGNWEGVLANSGEIIELRDNTGDQIDQVDYADEGDWAVRRRGRLRFGSRGWEWEANHDGLGCSVELINPGVAGNHGQNWMASLLPSGTPGFPNSQASTNLPPMILDTIHSPIVPTSSDTIRVTSRIIDESEFGLSLTLFYRDHSTESPGEFIQAAMTDNGLLGDETADDGIFSGQIPPQPDLTIIEFYVRAEDRTGKVRVWPAPGVDENEMEVQEVNALLQVMDEIISEERPLVQLIYSGTERAELASMSRASDAELNATLISRDGVNDVVRYNNGVRFRGASSRNSPIPNFRLNVPTDRRWQGLQAVNLNSFFPHAQLMGAILSSKVGLPSSDTRAVQVRVNGVNLARPGAPDLSAGDGFGIYALVEPLNSDWVKNHFPQDPDGNAYSARRPNPINTPDLSYRGTNFLNYSAAGYAKESNETENDWTDLIRLTDTLSNSSDLDYANAVKGVINHPNWIRYFALNALLGNSETSLATGSADDYNLVGGENDPRFYLIPHDWDSILVSFSLPIDTTIFRPTRLPILDRFLKHPDFAPLYFKEILQIMDEVCPQDDLDALLNQFIGSFADKGTINAMSEYYAQRSAHIRTQIPLELTVTNALPVAWGYSYTTSGTVLLFGTANAVDTRSVMVNGTPADYIAWQGVWTVNTTLRPGINRVFVKARNESGDIIESTFLDIYYDTGTDIEISGGELPTDTTWTGNGNAYHVNGPLTVPAGVTLTIEPGTTIFFGVNAFLTVNGTLNAHGTEEAPIRFLGKPQREWAWDGIRFENTLTENILSHAILDDVAPSFPVTAMNSRVTLDHIVFQVAHTCIYFQNSSMRIQNCHFPKMRQRETVIGNDILPGGELIFLKNYFGGTTGYNDLIDITAGSRPAPIVQVISNIFEFASDDALDVDGTDAHVEGNIFRHIHRDADRESIASGIATDAETHLVVTRNIFYDCDNGINLKRGAYAVVANNVFVGSSESAIAFGSTNRLVSPGAGAYIDGNIFWNNATHFAHHNDPGYSMAALDVRNNIIQGTNWPGPGNLSADPLFKDLEGDFRLATGSPALGSGPNGLDMGAHVPAGVSISGVPPHTTTSRSAVLRFDGPGYNNPGLRGWTDIYRYKINSSPWSGAVPISQPLRLNNLPDGTYTVQVIGRNSAGVWQTDENATMSDTWTVNTGLNRLVINEVLAHNTSISNHFGTTPDFIELHNAGASPVDLTGLQLTDNPDVPAKFVFPFQTIIPANGYLLLLADNPNGTPGLHVGFSLGKNGEGVYLFDSALRGTTLLDSVRFGIQIPDWSIARDEDSWGLAHPTLGGPNVLAQVAAPDQLHISEWLAAGSSDDYVELHNALPIPVDISSCHWTDHPWTWSDRHRITPLSFIAPNAYLDFKADKETDKGAHHLNFSLSYAQGSIAFFSPSLELIDQVIYGPQQYDVSMGFLTPTSLLPTPLPNQTPGDSNLNVPPTVYITNPAEGETITGLVTLEAIALDPDGAIERVEFFEDGNKVGEDDTFPYRFSWYPSPGTHSVFARAIDNRNASSDSNPVQFNAFREVYLTFIPVQESGKVAAFQISFDAAATTSYVLEGASDLGEGWSSILTIGAQPFDYTPVFEIPATESSRFFRLKVLR